MKRVVIWFGIGLVVAIAVGTWLARAAWRAHKNLVTLEVRNVPLREVVRKMERQTWEKVQVDQRLDGPVTLKLKAVPLEEALERLGEEVGARAETIHAVHRTDYPLRQLKDALGRGAKIGSVGWTNLAPRFAGDGPDAPMELGVLGSGNAAGGSGKGMVVRSDSEVSGVEVEKLVRQQLSTNGLDRMIPEGAVAEAIEKALPSGGQGAGGRVVVRSHASVVAGGPRVKVVTVQADDRDLPPEARQAISSAMAGGSAGGGFPSGSNVRVIADGLDGTNLPPEARAAISNALRGGSLSTSFHRSGTGGTVIAHSGTITMQPTVRMIRLGPKGLSEPAEEEIWSPERIVIETALEEQLGAEPPVSPTREAAEQAARKVHGHCTTLYALQKSDLPGMVLRSLRGSASTLPLDTGGKPLDPATMADRMAQSLKREKLEQYEKLTPEQRARRAREQRALSNPAGTNR